MSTPRERLVTCGRVEGTPMQSSSKGWSPRFGHSGVNEMKWIYCRRGSRVYEYDVLLSVRIIVFFPAKMNGVPQAGMYRFIHGSVLIQRLLCACTI